MSSELYQACAAGDISLVRALISTSTSTAELNRVESNGSTVLHLACWLGNRDMVQVLLDEFHINRHQRDANGQTAYETASEDIRQLFRRVTASGNPFSTDEHAVNPMEITSNPAIDDGSHWLQHYRNESPILGEVFDEVLETQKDDYKSLFFGIVSLFGYDHKRKQLDQWATTVGTYLDDIFPPGHSDRRKAHQLLEDFRRTRKIEYLFTLYTLNQSFSQYLAQDLLRTHFFLLQFKLLLHCVERRANRERTYRGLTMSNIAFAQYQRALNDTGCFIKTKTFCSTSPDRSVAEAFAGEGQDDSDSLHVLLIFDFGQSCGTAIALHAIGPDQPCISNFEDEQEVLLLPGTIFSVKEIERCPEAGPIKIYLEHLNMDREGAEMAEDRLRSYIDTFIYD